MSSDRVAPHGKKIASILFVLALVSLLLGFGLCGSGRSSAQSMGLAAFLAAPLLVAIGIVLLLLVDVRMLRRTGEIDAQRLATLRDILVGSAGMVSADAVLAETGWSLPDLWRVVSLLAIGGEIQFGSGADGITTMALRSGGNSLLLAGREDREPIPSIVLRASGENGLPVSASEAAAISNARRRWRIAAKASIAVGLVGGMAIPFSSILSNDSTVMAIELSIAAILVVLGILINIAVLIARAFVLARIEGERERTVLALFRAHGQLMTVTEIIDEIGWGRVEVERTIRRLTSKERVAIGRNAAGERVVRLRQKGSV